MKNSASSSYCSKQPPQYRFEVNLVWEDGVFARIPMGPEKEDQVEAYLEGWPNARIPDSHDLELPGVGWVRGGDLYENATSGNKTTAPGLWEPPFKYRQPPSA